MRKEIIGNCELYNGDCLEVLQTLGKIDTIITDPPYPDYLADEYFYKPDILDFLKNYSCKQLVFWTAKVEFPLDYTAIHIWDKKCGVGSIYERIFERNGYKGYKVFRHYLINSTVAAKYARDVYTGHPSQKPIGLIKELIEYSTKPDSIIFDPFMGSGSTGVGCVKTGRQFIGTEINNKYFDIACKRIEEAVKSKQSELFKEAV